MSKLLLYFVVLIAALWGLDSIFSHGRYSQITLNSLTHQIDNATRFVRRVFR